MSEAAIDEATADAEWAALEALHAEQQRNARGAPLPATQSEPKNPVQRAILAAIPSKGSVEYWRLMRPLGERYDLMNVQSALLELVLAGQAYVTPNHNGTTSVVGRGTDPRVGSHAYRTGAMG